MPSGRVSRIGFLKRLGLMAGLWPAFSSKEAIQENKRSDEGQSQWYLSEKVPILLITGIDHPAHDWRQTAPLLAAHIQRDPRLDVRIVPDPFFLDSVRIHAYRAVILHFMNWDIPSPGREARDQLTRFVASGGGLVLVHFACGAWQDWPQFVELAGRVWDPQLRPHDPRGVFVVRIVDSQHPITSSLCDFATDDELYTCLAGDKPIQILATAKSCVDGLEYPIAFVHTYYKGRVFHCVLGHDSRAFEAEQVGELFRRGTAWAAGLLPFKN